LKKLAEETGGVISHEGIRLLENGLRIADEPTLKALCQALGVTRKFLTSPQLFNLGQVEFRKTSRTTSADRAAVKAELLDLLDRYLEVEDLLELDEQWEAPVFDIAMRDNDIQGYAEEMAVALRERWGLGLEPIGDLTKVLEEKGLKILMPEASVDISGLTCEVHRKDRASVFAIVVNRQHTLERRRFTIAHELAHRVLNFHGLKGKTMESLCNRFAGAFLVPKETLYREMGKRNHVPAYQEVIMAKRYFRVSAAMLVMRLEQIGIVDRVQRDFYFQNIGQGWRTNEPEPLEHPPKILEQPRRFERLVFLALASDYIFEGKAAELLRVPLREVKHGLRGRSYGMD
jgi:Zn-dependent peptidase ImmA (M78 family)